jgi:hypothetical protein
MILWRIWHIHNEITHQKPLPSVEGSKRFLASYLESLLLIKQFPNADPVKGKSVVVLDQGFACGTKSESRRKDVIKWLPPVADMAKLNTDGSFMRSQQARELHRCNRS